MIQVTFHKVDGEFSSPRVQGKHAIMFKDLEDKAVLSIGQTLQLIKVLVFGSVRNACRMPGDKHTQRLAIISNAKVVSLTVLKIVYP